PVAVDVRVVSASHLDLARLVAEKRFRADLEARLAGVQIDVPPLRERREDLGLLAGAILRRGGAGEVALPRAAAGALLRYPWPKNIREVEQALTAAVVLAGRAPVTLKNLRRRCASRRRRSRRRAPRTTACARSWSRSSRPRPATSAPWRAPWARRASRSSAGSSATSWIRMPSGAADAVLPVEEERDALEETVLEDAAARADLADEPLLRRDALHDRGVEVDAERVGVAPVVVDGPVEAELPVELLGLDVR